MPNLQIEGLDRGYFEATIRQKYLSQFRAKQQVYYWFMLALGSLFFLIGGII